MKKTILSVGFLVTTIVPVATIVSCSSNDSSSKENNSLSIEITKTFPNLKQNTNIGDERNINNWILDEQEKLEKEDKIIKKLTILVKEGILLKNQQDVNKGEKIEILTENELKDNILVKSQTATIDVTISAEIKMWQEFGVSQGTNSLKNHKALNDWLNRKYNQLKTSGISISKIKITGINVKLLNASDEEFPNNIVEYKIENGKLPTIDAKTNATSMDDTKIKVEFF